MHPVRHADLPESYPPTGEPDAGELPVRFGGRGKADLCPYPYRNPKVPYRRVRCDSCRSAHRFDDWSDEISNTKTETETRRTCRREIPLGLAAPAHTVPYGTVLSRDAFPGTSFVEVRECDMFRG